MLLPILIALGVIVILAKTSHANIQGVPVSSPTVRQWRTQLIAIGFDIPIDAAEAWLAEESGGNICAIGETPPPGASQPQEYGLAQLNAKDPDNIAIASPEALRGNGLCGSGPSRAEWEKQLRPMTEAEKYTQAAAAIQLMRHCASKARAYLGSDSGWGTPDFWRLAKCYHASSAVANLFPAIVKQMNRKPTWLEFEDIASRIALSHGFSQHFLDRVWLNSNAVGNALLGKGVA